MLVFHKIEFEMLFLSLYGQIRTYRHIVLFLNLVPTGIINTLKHKMHLEIKCYLLDPWFKISKNSFSRHSLSSLLVYNTSRSGATWWWTGPALLAGSHLLLWLVPEAFLQNPKALKNTLE